MKILCDFNLISIGSGTSISNYVAECVRIFREMGLKTSIHALGTNIEGDFDKVTTAIEECHKRLHDMGVPRLLSTLKISSRIDKEQSIEEKIASVYNKL